MESLNKTISSTHQIPDDWGKCMDEKYKFIDFIGKGTFGTVFKAKCKTTGNIVAVKHLTNIFRNSYAATKVAREIQLLTQLSTFNVSYFAKLLEVVIPYEKETTPSTGNSPTKGSKTLGANG